MQVVSSTEFATHQQKYFNLARQQQVFVRDGDYTLKIISEPTVREQKILQPDDDLCNSLSAEEFKKGAIEIVRKVHHKFYGNERQVCPRNV
ncbi:MAG: hypothetical protein FWG79_03425 [Bacteroidales bacterium]|nr:hypothetical protein [Bacteroidales bacterium]